MPPTGSSRGVAKEHTCCDIWSREGTTRPRRRTSSVSALRPRSRVPNYFARLRILRDSSVDVAVGRGIGSIFTYLHFPVGFSYFSRRKPFAGWRQASERASACVRRVSAVVLSFLCKYEYLFSCSSRGNSIGPRVRITCAGERGVCASRWNIVVCILVFLHVSSFCAANIRACCARRRAPGDRGVLRSSNIASVVFVPFYLCILKFTTTKKGIGRLTIFFIIT